MRVFTVGEYMRGRIPRREDFLPVSQSFRDEVSSLIPGKVIGAVAYGSVARGDWSLTSDLDYFILAADESAEDRIQQLAQRAWDEKNVTIEARVITPEVAASGRHGIDAPFAEHLSAAAQHGYLGDNPIPMLAPTGMGWEQECTFTLIRYLVKLTKDCTHARTSESDDTRIVKRIFEKPYHTMRVMVQFNRGPRHSGAPLPATRAEVSTAYQETSFGSLRELLVPLETARAAYLDLLHDRLNNPPQLEEYRSVLQQMRDCYAPARRFVQENLLRMR